MANLVNTLLKNRKLQSVITKAKTTNAAIPKVEDPTLQTWIKAIDSNLKEAAKKAVTKGDLINLGLAGVKNGNLEGLIPKPEQVDLTVPAAVANLQANGAYSTVTLDWETPPNANFGYNAVYRSEINDFGAAIQIGSTLGDVYTDYIGNAAKVYYWVRTISKYDVEGDLAPSVYAETSINIPYLIEQLTGKINSNQFTQSLKTEIERIDANAKAIVQEAKDRANALLEERVKYAASLLEERELWQAGLAQEALNRVQAVSDAISSLMLKISAERVDWMAAVLKEAQDRAQSINEVVNDYVERFSQERVDWQNAIADEAAATKNRIDQTVTDFSDRLSTEVTARQDQIQAEAEARQEAITQEASNRADAIAAETTTRQQEITAEALARAEGDKAVDSRVDNLVSAFDDNDREIRGLIIDEAETRANETGVISTKLDGVFAQVNPTMAGGSEPAGSDTQLAGVWTETSARIEGDLVLSERIDVVQSVIQTNDKTVKALITQEQQTRATTDAAMASQMDIMSASIKTNDTEVKALITAEQTTRANADGALSQRIDTIQAKTDQNIAAITAEQTARAAADQAMAGQINTLTAQTEDVLGLITTEQEVRSSQVEALSRELTFISAGVGEQFDTKVISFFDEGDEGWTCETGQPIVENGYIRAADSATPNYLISPANGEIINGSAYPHLRARIRKVGTPSWTGQILYGENFSQSFELVEPTWDIGDFGILSSDIGWQGQIGQVKVKFSDSQDPDNYFFADWIAIGRPSPSASYSALSEEQQARAEADRANADSIRALTATVKDNDISYKALIAEEERVRVEQDLAQAERTELLEATIEDQAALIASEQTARIEANEVLAGQIDSIRAENKNNLALIQEEQTARVDGDSANATAILQLSAEFEEKDAETRSLITQEQETRADALEAMASDLQQLSADFENKDTEIRSLITQEQEARADENEAITTQINQLSAEFGDEQTAVRALISEEAEARADENGALSTKIDGVFAQVNPVMAGDESGLAGNEGHN
ncbi:hypothetical protein, partial [Acinetobacter variabilis]